MKQTVSDYFVFASWCSMKIRFPDLFRFIHLRERSLLNLDTMHNRFLAVVPQRRPRKKTSYVIIVKNIPVKD
jgi:hypothetical protein